MILLAVLVAIAILLAIAHEVIEARIFSRLQNQPGIELSVQSRSGNLFSGYNLHQVSVRQTEGGQDSPPATFSTGRISVHWKLNPFKLREISWDTGTLVFNQPDGDSEEIPIGSGTLAGNETVWLEPESPVTIGPETWHGTADIRLRADATELDATIVIDRLPGRMLELMGAPAGDFSTPSQVKLEMDLSGNPQKLNASGQVTDTYTRRSYRF